METEARLEAKMRAGDEAIRVFLAKSARASHGSSARTQRLMAIDPGFRTGCKVACISAEEKTSASSADIPHPVRGNSRLRGARQS